MITVTRKFRFSAGHRIFGHEGACASLHGHDYVANITAQSEQLDGIGRVIDFGVLKEKIDPWIQNNWDHAFLWWEKDPVGDYLFGYHYLEHPKVALNPVAVDIYRMRNFKCSFNPTAEEMARYLLGLCPKLLEPISTQIRVIRVELFETENCKAVAELP